MITVPATSPALPRIGVAFIRTKKFEPSGRLIDSVPSQSRPRQACRSRFATLDRSSSSKPSARNGTSVRWPGSGKPNRLGGEVVGVTQAAVVVDDDHRGLDLAKDLRR